MPERGTSEFDARDAGAAPAPALSDDRRKSRQLLARWRDARGDRAMPSWECHGRVVGDLDAYCIMGHFGHDRAEAVTGKIGGFFLDRLEAGDGAQSTDPYPAAVVMGIIRSLGTQLLHGATPILHEGEFQTDTGALIRYRTAVLPFGEPGHGPDHWLALGSWRSAVSDRALRAA
ncbi:MAG: hypothetical protein HOH66_09545 [Rhodospirillaceae bacterium]|jgi:hypothetical protein|nr:hypothetical protein [Rhodospirillaceae bacterium]MBT6118096.1 hypothetical protein [Rhodospirillaceae bacterium]